MKKPQNRQGKARLSYERYDLSRSPLAQRPTQSDLADLLRISKSQLKTIAQPNYKERFLVRRTIVSSVKKRLVRSQGSSDELLADDRQIAAVTSGGKERHLVYPVALLRVIHERLKFHLNKIIQPHYLMSPRKSRTQSDNALEHQGQGQYLTLDLKQFYPSTDRLMIRASLVSQFGMYPDVAGLIAHLATADDRACFGSPLTPVLVSIVHRPMVNAISELCDEFDLRYTVWVDDLTISGQQIPSDFVSRIRNIIAEHGLKSHKLKYRTGNKVVFITGVGVVGEELVVPKHIELRGKLLWDSFNQAITVEEREVAANKLLAHLGFVRQIVGVGTRRGQRIADQINGVKQKRNSLRARRIAEYNAEMAKLKHLSPEEMLAYAEANPEQYSEIPF